MEDGEWLMVNSESDADGRGGFLKYEEMAGEREFLLPVRKEGGQALICGSFMRVIKRTLTSIRRMARIIAGVKAPSFVLSASMM